jgi:hypothetical protein
MGLTQKAKNQSSVSKRTCHATATIQLRALHARQACVSRVFYA